MTHLSPLLPSLMIFLAAAMPSNAASAPVPPVPSQEQIAAFSSAVEKAWKSGDAAALGNEREQNGITEGLIDVHLMYWETLIQRNQEKPQEWGGVKYLSREEALTEVPGRNVATLRSAIDDYEVNGRKYVVNLPVSGFVTLYVWGKSGILTPVGINDKGQLKMAEHVPADGKSDEYRLPSPISVQGVATGAPSEEAVARFKTAVAKAFEAGDLLPVTHTDGVPLDQLDRQTWQRQKFSSYNDVLDKVEFTPASESGSEPQRSSLPTNEPVKWGHHWYALNLPFVGYTRIVTSSSDKKSGSATMSLPTGITPSGELKLIRPALVTPPSP